MKYQILFFALLSIYLYACPVSNTPAKPTSPEASSIYDELVEYDPKNAEDGTYKISYRQETLGKVDVENKTLDRTLTMLDMFEKIPARAFFDKSLTHVIVPETNTIKVIEGWAFWSNNLTVVAIPESVSYIGVKAFEFNKIKTLVLPELIRYIGDVAFGTNNLKKIRLPESIDKKNRIGVKAFIGNDELTEVTLSKELYDDFKTKSELESKFGKQVTTYKDLNGKELAPKDK